MLRCCIVCKAEASLDLQLQYCAACQSALYCSEACQRKDWRKQHKKICKLLNVGHGDMQVRNDNHVSRSIILKEAFEEGERRLDEEDKRFFKLFEESTFEGSRAAARKMKKIAQRQTKHNQKCLLFYSLRFLIRSSDSKMLSWPSSPLLVMLQFIDPNVLSRSEHEPLQEGQTRFTPLHRLGELADHKDYSTHENQPILATQLIEHGANVNAVSIPQGRTTLYNVCHSRNVTNLDFVELLLEAGADPNFQDHLGMIPLMCITPAAPGAAKFLLNCPTTDANITSQSGASFLAWARLAITAFSNQITLPANPNQVQHQFLLQQWRDIEVMLLERSQ
jgi:hypothetical protein